MTMKNNELFVYGTLRRDDAEETKLADMRRDDTDPYPTIYPEIGRTVEGQIIEVDDWEALDRYEGRVPSDPEKSLYWRLSTATGVQVYVGNPRSPFALDWSHDLTYDEAKDYMKRVEVIR